MELRFIALREKGSFFCHLNSGIHMKNVSQTDSRLGQLLYFFLAANYLMRTNVRLRVSHVMKLRARAIRELAERGRIDRLRIIKLYHITGGIVLKNEVCLSLPQLALTPMYAFSLPRRFVKLSFFEQFFLYFSSSFFCSPRTTLFFSGAQNFTRKNIFL